MITIEGVSKAFRPAGGGPPNTVLRSVSITVPPSCIYGLIGPGASGKSILLKMIVGLMKPDTGRIIVDNDDVTAASELDLQKMRLKFGMLFQNNALFDHMTVDDNIAFPLRRLTNLDEASIKARVADRLKVVSLPDFGGRLPAGLSGGQKKRVGFARATITQSPIVLYDEPAAGLDPVTSQRIFDMIRTEQRASNATVVVVSSDLDRLLTVTDRVGMMYRGQLIFDGTTEEAKSSTNPYVRQFVHGLTEGPL